MGQILDPGSDCNFILSSSWQPERDTNGRVTLCLENSGNHTITDFALHVTMIVFITSETTIVGANLADACSTYHVLTPPEGSSLEPGEKWQVTLINPGHELLHANDGPKSAFLTLPGEADKPIPVRIEPMASVEAPHEPNGLGNSDNAPSIGPMLGVLPCPQHADISDWSGKEAPAFHLSQDLPDEARRIIDNILSLAQRLYPEQPSFLAGDSSNQGPALLISLGEGPRDESYRLTIESDHAKLDAGTETGLRHGLITLAQICIASHLNPELFPFPLKADIRDWPRFSWRGGHLDMARHFFPAPQVSRFIDILAWQKFNRFHCHLTDDEGWRIEVPSLPHLTEIGAYRGHGLAIPPQLHSGADKYGGFYDRETIRQWLRQAEGLGVELIPEVDLPGHCFAILQSYPELVDPADRSHAKSVQYFKNNVINPGMPETYRFLETALTEVAELFPSPWFHIGGDEVAPGSWEQSPACLKWSEASGISGKDRIQAHLLQQASRVLKNLGKRIGGWEEAAAEGGIAPGGGNYLIAWQNAEIGFELATKGHDIVMAPAQHFYLDVAQSTDWSSPGTGWAGVNSLEDAYRYDVMEDWPDQSSSGRMLGIQACLWTEHVHDIAGFNMLVFPRLSALAEGAWILPDSKDYNRFRAISTLMPTL
ncbi:beta-N-acetylhexosaminidase [Aestuariispira insulae]|uniref:beta-N-acetylhexosaminidase n=1 Tax=Aestuariispira insulae TaxID=1461337 RepID=A0A3D9HW63_9PROT|nr:family 20 glycosylhydrolase [Aestuariispira insulae]RED53753.1 hexosaminidase [Aestuariispira insulae]